MAAQTETRHDRKERYHALLRVIAANTTRQQPPAARRHTMMHIMCSSGYGADGVESSIRAACERGEVWSFVDPDGVARLVLVTEVDLARLVKWLAEDDHPDHQLIGRVNRRVQEVRSDG